MAFKQFLKPSSENLTRSAKLSPTTNFGGGLSNFYYWVKPDWRKITIFIVLFFTSILTSKTDFMGGELIAIFISFNPVLWLPLFLFLGGCSNVNFGDHLRFKGFCYKGDLFGSITFLVGAVFSIIYWYLLSCLIIWIYDKIRKKS